MELVNLPDYFRRKKLLTFEQAESANRYIGNLDNDFRLMELDLANEKIQIGRRSACLFIDWLFESGLQGEFTFCHFISKTVKTLAIARARRLNQKTESKHRAKGLLYFVEAISAAALCVLFGGTYRRILRIETVQRLPGVVDYVQKRVRNGNETLEPKKKLAVLVNGQYKVFASNIFLDFVERETGQFFVISEHQYCPDYWTVGRRMHTRSSMVQTAVGIAASNIVGMEIGRAAQKVCELIGEHRDLRRGRPVDYRWDVIEASYAFCDTCTELDWQTLNIIRVELGRPVNQPNCYEYYITTSLTDRPSKQVYYRKLKAGQKLMTEQFNDEGF